LFLSALIQKGLLSEEQARQILLEIKSTNKRAEEIIVRKKFSRMKKISLKVKSVSFLNYRLKFFTKNETIPQTILNIIPEDTARHYKFIAFNKEGNTLEVGMVFLMI